MLEAGRRGFCRVSLLCLLVLWPIRVGRQNADAKCGIPGATNLPRNGRELITQAFGPSSIILVPSISTASTGIVSQIYCYCYQFPFLLPSLFPALSLLFCCLAGMQKRDIVLALINHPIQCHGIICVILRIGCHLVPNRRCLCSILDSCTSLAFHAALGPHQVVLPSNLALPKWRIRAR